ncbi:hypothetical protein MRB53_026011 [Persea americana]|uniref:Uncharacterized protein n=1 Tax=Persea americana TaxID=3435 RepID=A0ACC2LHE4_PERAE|nr:hypothetical protein MRB53_026011 [Persea americana]
MRDQSKEIGVDLRTRRGFKDFWFCHCAELEFAEDLDSPTVEEEDLILNAAVAAGQDLDCVLLLIAGAEIGSRANRGSGLPSRWRRQSRSKRRSLPFVVLRQPETTVPCRTSPDIEKNKQKGSPKEKNILIQQGIKLALLGKEKKPERIDADEWADIDERAMSSIEQYLSDEVMFNVMEEEFAKDLWEKLDKLCMGKNLTNKLHLKKQLNGLKMEEGCGLMEHMDTFNRMISDLLRSNVEFDDEDRFLLLLNSLSGPYEHFVITLLYGKETQF